MIEFEDAGFSYARTPVLRATTLTVAPGSLTVLVGPSGAGKTTLLRLCWLDLRPTEGAVRLFGRRVGRNDRKAVVALRRALGIVPQEDRFIEHLSVLDNVALPLRVGGVAPEARADDLRALLDWVGIADVAEMPPAALGRGGRRLAALARAVILSPELVLVDEPAGGLDRDAAEHLLALLAELHRMGKTVLVATHDRAHARMLAARAPARVLTLAGGRIEAAEIAA